MNATTKMAERLELHPEFPASYDAGVLLLDHAPRNLSHAAALSASGNLLSTERMRLSLPMTAMAVNSPSKSGSFQVTIC